MFCCVSEVIAVHKCAKLDEIVDFEKCCKLSVYIQKSASIHPSTICQILYSKKKDIQNLQPSHR